MLHEYVKLIWVINRQLCAYQNDMCNLPNLFAKHWRTQRLYFVACGICSRPAQWVGAPVWSVLGWWHSLSPYTSHHKSNGLFLWFYPLYSSFCSKWGEQKHSLWWLVQWRGRQSARIEVVSSARWQWLASLPWHVVLSWLYWSILFRNIIRKLSSFSHWSLSIIHPLLSSSTISSFSSSST